MADKSSMSRVQDQRLTLLTREILRSAGFKPEHLRESYQATRDALKANRITVSPLGERIDLGADHRIRLAGADQMYRMIGMYASEQDQRHGGGVVVEVQLLTPDGGRTVIRVGSGTPDVVTDG